MILSKLYLSFKKKINIQKSMLSRVNLGSKISGWSNLISSNVFKFSTWPVFKEQKLQNPKTIVYVIHSQQASNLLSAKKLQKFKKDNKVAIEKQQVKQVYLSEKLWEQLDKKLNLGYNIEADSHVIFSQKFTKDVHYFVGYASYLLSTPYKFSRKQQEKPIANISVNEFSQKQYILQLVQARLRSRQWTNARADQATPQYFLTQSQRIFESAKSKHGNNVQITAIKGDNLLDQGFRLMHAVGRASRNQPVFINLTYKGNPNSDQYHALVGKGVCFDTGGLNLKPTTSIKQMHTDMNGAASILSAFETITNLQLPVNVTASMGFVENFVSDNSYRPLDIIKSRKGLTVQIGNTDAQGRLVLADCMNWTQQKYKCKDLVQLSTLTGAIIIALGKKHAGLFSNSDQLSQRLLQTGNHIGQKLWRMPVDTYHHDIVKPKTADLSNAPGKPQASSSQAAAFLQNFVQKGVLWAHIDIAGTSMVDSDATGYGARLLVEYLKNSA